MPWIVLRYWPGFAEDLTSWHTEISYDGHLKQVVDVCRVMSDEKRIEVHERQLSARQLRRLTKLIAQADLVELSSLESCIDDAEEFCWEIEKSGRLFKLHAALRAMLMFQRLDKRVPDERVADALRLWNAIALLSPFPGQRTRKR